MITYDAKVSNDYHIIVEHYPSYTVPKRSITKVSVPGRNGDLLIDNGNYENVTAEYDIALDAHSVGFSEAFQKAVQFISSTGYQRLEDTYDTTVYRMAYVENEIQLKNYLHKMGRGTLKFNCKPFRWLKSGETAITISATNTQITNPTKYASKPLIKVIGTAAGTITIGNIQMTIKTLADYLYIDCEEMNVYRQTSENMNSCVALGEFCEIPADTSVIYFDGGITSLEITPRWVTL